MEELLLALLGVIAEVAIETLDELAVELIAAFVARVVRRIWKATLRLNPFLTCAFFFLCGAVSGGLSILIFPHPLMHRSHIRDTSLVISPLLTGAVMSLIGRGVRRRGRQSVRIESFGYGYVFAFAMALVRVLFAQ